jgi:hypothetical protein
MFVVSKFTRPPKFPFKIVIMCDARWRGLSTWYCTSLVVIHLLNGVDAEAFNEDALFSNIGTFSKHVDSKK